MDTNTKNLWLSRIRTGKVPVIESMFAPNNTNCIWLNNGVLKAYTNAGWEEFSSESSSKTKDAAIFGAFSLPITFDEVTLIGGGTHEAKISVFDFRTKPNGCYVLPCIKFIVNDTARELVPYIIIKQKYTYQWDDGGGGRGFRESKELKEDTKEEKQTLQIPERQIVKSGNNEPVYDFFVKRLQQYYMLNDNEYSSTLNIEISKDPYVNIAYNSFIDNPPLGTSPYWDFANGISITSAIFDKDNYVKDLTADGVSQEDIEIGVEHIVEACNLDSDYINNTISFRCSTSMFSMFGNYGPEGYPEAIMVFGVDMNGPTLPSTDYLFGLPDSWKTLMNDPNSRIVAYGINANTE